MFEAKIITNKPAYRPRPKHIAGYHKFTNESFDAFVHKDNVLKVIESWTMESRYTEIVGRLVGRPYRDNCGEWAILTGAILANAVGGPATVKTTIDDCAKIARILEQEHPTEELIGWFHSHPCGLDEYSSTDKRNQAEWSKPYHIGLLVSFHGNSATIHAFCSPESKRMSPSFELHDLSHYKKENESEQPLLYVAPEPDGMPVITAFATKQQAPVARSWLKNLTYLMLWSVVFLIGVHLLSNAISHIQIPVVIHENDEKMLYDYRLIQTEETIDKIGAELDERTAQIQQQLEDIQAHQEGNQDGINLLNWIAGYLETFRNEPSKSTAQKHGKSH